MLGIGRIHGGQGFKRRSARQQLERDLVEVSLNGLPRLAKFSLDVAAGAG
ncbi:MAG: hypothetical protein ACI8TQ_000448, partial [Planctomycetota bacterium]